MSKIDCDRSLALKQKSETDNACCLNMSSSTVASAQLNMSAENDCVLCIDNILDMHQRGMKPSNETSSMQNV